MESSPLLSAPPSSGRKNISCQQMAQELLSSTSASAPFVFSSPGVTLLAKGDAHAYKSVVKFAELDHYVNSLLAKHKRSAGDNPIALGVIPFSEHNPVRFVIPEQTLVSSSLRLGQFAGHCPHAARSVMLPLPQPQTYMSLVEQAERACACGQLDKVVLSRAMQVDTDEEIALNQLLLTLLQQNPHGYTFCANIGDEGEARHLIGSSPELLVSRKGSAVSSNPLAGSRRRAPSAEQNQALEQDLLNSDKDLHEHAVVVESVERALQPYCSNLYVPMIPSVIETPAMLHLSTLVEGSLLDPGTSVLKLASELHPTPAVCGFPRLDAHQFIQQAEPFDRGYFTGLVGWCDSRGNGEWVVVIRCAEVAAKQLKLFAGAGIVSGSVPLSELQETGNKMRTILHALGMDWNENEMLESA